MTEPKLLPCPCCKGYGGICRWDVAPDPLKKAAQAYSTYRAYCKDCGLSTIEYKFREEAIAAWNTRPIEAELVEDLEQIAYGYSTINFDAADWMQQRAREALTKSKYHSKRCS